MSWLGSALVSLGRIGYAGAFLAGFLGASIPFFPSYILIPLMATQLNPIIVGVVSGIGAGLGQYLHYYIGLGGRHLFSPETQARFERWRDRLGKYGFWLITILAATPLTPDDVIWIPLGLMRYPKTKALIGGVTGKTTLSLFYAYAGYYGSPFIQNLLGDCGLT
jgi:membrane protein YqaA with SNARE-associated domain